jgi:hypothetical protein
MPITPNTGSLFHAETHDGQIDDTTEAFMSWIKAQRLKARAPAATTP